MTPGARVAWIRPGDLNGFLGLALDNVTQLVILSGVLIGVFQFPADLVLYQMVPGTALGVLVGDLAYTWLAVRLMRRTGFDADALALGAPPIAITPSRSARHVSGRYATTTAPAMTRSAPSDSIRLRRSR